MRTSTGWIFRPDRYAHPWDLVPEPRQYTGAPELTSSRLPTIHLSKSKVFLRRQTLRVRRRSPFQRPIGRSGEAESYRSSRPCQSAPRKIFVQPSKAAAKTATPATYVASLGSEQLSKGVANCNGRPGPNFAAVQSTAANPDRVVGTKPNQLSGGIIYPPSLACQPLGGRFHSRRVDVSTLR